MRGQLHTCVRVLSALVAVAACGSGDQVLTADDDSNISARDASTGSSSDGNDPGDDASTDPTEGSSGDDGATLNGDAGTRGVAQDADCDMNGIWIARQQTVNQALGLPQTANNWYYFELSQAGTRFRVVDHFDCGIEVLGTAHVQLTRQATETLISHNVEIGRQGTMQKGGDGTCALELERFWSIRGADEASFVPNTTRDSDENVAEVKSRLPLPSRDDTSGAEDWDGDGKLGIAWNISGIVSGVRNSVQRDWTHWFTDAEHTIAPALDFTSDLVVRTEFDAEESVLDPAFGTLASTSQIDNTVAHIVTLRLLGRDADDARVKALVKSTKLETCYAIQAALPAGEL